MKKIMSSFFCLLFLTPASFGGSSVGNGGDVIVCKNLNNEISSVELLDFYEARVEEGLKIDLSSNDSTEVNVQKMIERIGHHENYFKNLLADWFNDFYANALFIENVDLVDIPDSNHLTIPKGCKVEQAAIQKVPTNSLKKFYTISKDLWDKMDSVSRAGLIVHELIFKSLTLYSKSDYDSTNVRHLNSLAASNKIASLDFSYYVKLMLKLSVPYVAMNNIFVPTSSIHFSADNKLLSYRLSAQKSENQKSILHVTPELFIEYDGNGGSVTVDFSDEQIIRVYPGMGQPKLIVYQGRKFQTQEIWPRLELNKSDAKLLKILTYTNHGRIIFEVPSIFDPKIMGGAKCTSIDFSRAQEGFFECYGAQLMDALFSMNIHGSQMSSQQTLEKEAIIVVYFNNFLFSKLITSEFDIDFESRGFVKEVICKGSKETGFGSIRLSPLVVKNPIAVGIDGLETLVNELLCHESFPLKNEFSKEGIVFNGSSLNLGKKIVFGPTKDLQCAPFEGESPRRIVSTPKYEAYLNGQTIRLTVAVSTLPPFTYTNGKKFRALAGDVLRLNPDGYVEEIERNFCREIARK